MFDAARRGEVAEMYPGGREQRTADIQSGARRSAAEIVADVTTTVVRLEELWKAMPPEAWTAKGITIAGEETMSDLLFVRWRETEVHHADLGLGYSWSDWDPEYVRLDLVRLGMLWASRKPMGMTALPAQAMAVSDHHRLAWLLGRAELDGLARAEIMG